MNTAESPNKVAETVAIAKYASEIAESVRVAVSSGANEDRRKAARRLAELGVWTRRSTLPRGTPEAAAKCRLPNPEQEQALIACLSNTDGELRRQIVSALGHWGGEASAAAIRDLLLTSADLELVDQHYCIASLETIGGPTAVSALHWAAAHDGIHHPAAYSLHRLETGGTWDYSEGTPIPATRKTDSSTKEVQDVSQKLGIIGEMLTSTVHSLSHMPDRRLKLQDSIGRGKVLSPRPRTWEMDVLLQAHAHKWPGWAVECLPSLYIRLQPSTGGGETSYVWHYLCACFPESNACEVLDPLCDGHVLKVSLDENNVKFARFVAPILEEQRLANPFSSARAMAGVVLEALETLSAAALEQQDTQAAAALGRVHNLLLVKAKLPAPQQEFPDVYSYVEWLKTNSPDPEIVSALQIAYENLSRTLPASHPQTKLVAAALALVAENRKDDADRVPSVRALLESTSHLYQDRQLWRDTLRETTSKIALPSWLVSSV